ncbi:MAG: FAD-dependent oxidoreductase, partial [Burkholderiales bacterium]
MVQPAVRAGSAAVVGAGWAGLACAVELAAAGWQVTVFEAGKVAGGRARSVAGDDALGTVDNGQHVLIGPYRATFAL